MSAEYLRGRADALNGAIEMLRGRCVKGVRPGTLSGDALKNWLTGLRYSMQMLTNLAAEGGSQPDPLREAIRETAAQWLGGARADDFMSDVDDFHAALLSGQAAMLSETPAYLGWFSEFGVADGQSKPHQHGGTDAPECTTCPGLGQATEHAHEWSERKHCKWGGFEQHCLALGCSATYNASYEPLVGQATEGQHECDHDDVYFERGNFASRATWRRCKKCGRREVV